MAAAAFLAGLMTAWAGLPFWTAGFVPALTLPFTLKKRRLSFLLGTAFLLACFFWGRQVMEQAAGPSCPLNKTEGDPVTVTGQVLRYEIKDQTVCYYLKITSGYHQVMAAQSHSTAIIARPGMKVRVTGRLSLFQEATNPGQFHQRLYYKSLNVDYRIRDPQITVLDSKTDRFRDGLFKLQSRFCGSLYQMTDEKTAGILCAMLFGEKNRVDSACRDLFQRNGIAHILAISGLHISFLGACVYRLLRKCRCPMTATAAAGGLFTLCFGLLTGLSVSAFRAVIMYLVSLGARVAGRTYDMPSALSLAAILVLAERPYALFQSSLQYSFGAVCALALLPDSPADNLKNPVLRAVFKSLYVSAGIQLFTLPIQLYHAYYVPTYGFLLNLVVVPSMGLALLSGMAAAVSGMVFPGLFPVLPACLLTPCRLLLRGYEILCRAAETLPGNLIVAGRPSVGRILFFYGLLLGGIFLGKKWTGKTEAGPCGRSAGKSAGESAGKSAGESAGKQNRVRKAVLLAVPLCCLAAMLAPASYRGIQIHMLDVGQGEAICLRLPGGKTLLLDGGSTDVSQVGKYRIRPFLMEKGISHIDGVLISHLDQDHISGIRELLAENGMFVQVKKLILPAAARYADGGKEDPVFQKLIREAAAAGAGVELVKEGDQLSFSETGIRCLLPGEEERPEDRNTASAVYTFTYGNFRMLLTGDLPASRDRLLAEKGLPVCQVLKVAHHGSEGSTSMKLLEQVRPAVALISCGKDNRYHHPHQELLNRLAQVRSRVLCTKDLGAVCLQVRPDGTYRLGFGQTSPFSTLFKRSASTSMAFSSS